jgi:hypothetical protein
MDKAVVTALLIWLMCWLLDLLGIVAPQLIMLFLVLKIVVVALGVMVVGRLFFGFRPWTYP